MVLKTSERSRRINRDASPLSLYRHQLGQPRHFLPISRLESEVGISDLAPPKTTWSCVATILLRTLLKNGRSATGQLFRPFGSRDAFFRRGLKAAFFKALPDRDIYYILDPITNPAWHDTVRWGARVKTRHGGPAHIEAPGQLHMTKTPVTYWDRISPVVVSKLWQMGAVLSAKCITEESQWACVWVCMFLKQQSSLAAWQIVCKSSLRCDVGICCS